MNSAFPSCLAVKKDVAAATQNQALSVILFLYKKALDMEPAWLDGFARAWQVDAVVWVSALGRDALQTKNRVALRAPGRSVAGIEPYSLRGAGFRRPYARASGRV